MWFYNRKILILSKAIKEKSIVRFSFMGHDRLVEPHLLGVQKKTKCKVLYAWFIDGYSKTGFKNPNIRWRAYPLRKIKNIEITEEQFKTSRSLTNIDDTNFDKIISKVEYAESLEL